MTSRLYAAASLLLLLSACDSVGIVDPFSALEPYAATELADHERTAMEGVFSTAGGAEIFGARVVLKWNGKWLNIYAEKDGIVGALQAMQHGPNYDFTGRMWLNDSDRMFDLRLTIRSFNGGDSIFAGLRPSRIVVEGCADESCGLRFEFAGPVNRTRPFIIAAHGGGFNNAGRFNVPVNSLAMIRTAERFGANGVEVDVRITKDGVPILFHDDNFSCRMIVSEHLFGPVKDYNFAHVRSFGRLSNGEPVPTLREALEAALHETSIEFFQLDVKNPETLPALFDIQKEYHEKARALNRTFRIYMDLATTGIAEAYLRDPRSADALCMCELDEAMTLKVNARIWSPRWTLGTMTERARAMRGKGILFMPWTVNERPFIDALLREDQADGVLTDFPNLVAFKWYSFEK